jgi:type I restriction enzyme S subunit
MQNLSSRYDELRGLTGKDSRSGLNLDLIRKLDLLMPPPEERRGIADTLDAIDEAIEKTEAVIKATERLRQGLVQDLLTRGLPGRHTDWKHVSGLGVVPASWEIRKLGELVEVRSGQADPRDAKYADLQFIAPDDIEEGTRHLLRVRTVREAAAISGKYFFNEGDVLYSKIRPYLRKVYLPNCEGLCSADMYPIRPLDGLRRDFLSWVLLSRHFTSYSATCSDRTGIPKINRPDLLNYELALPPCDEQEHICAALEAASASLTKQREHLVALQELKSSCADDMLSGRLRVGCI